MVPIRTLALACVLLPLMFADRNIRRIIVTGPAIEIEGLGELDLDRSGDVETLLATLHEMCEYYNTCSNTTDIPAHVQQQLGCCVPCDCSDDCYAKGNCCRDKEEDTVTRNQNGEAMTARGETCSEVNQRDPKMLESYLMVAQCPPGYQGVARAKCDTPHGNTIEDLAPVVSSETGISYANIHCAYCNNQNESLVAWNIWLSCKNYRPMRHEGTILTVDQDECVFYMSPDNAEKCFTPGRHNDCEDVEFNNLCGIVEGTQYVKEFTLQACYFCDLPLAEYEFCEDEMIPPSTYEALLNWNLHSAAKTLDHEPGIPLQGTENMCLDDKFTKSEACPTLTCSPSQLEVGTDKRYCVDTYTASIGLCLDYSLDVTVPTRDNWTPEEADELVRSALLPDHLLNELSETVESQSDGDGTTTTYKLRLYEAVYQVDVHFMYEQLESRLQINTLPPGVRIVPGTGMSFMPMSLLDIGFLSYAGEVTLPHECMKLVAMSELQFCQMAMFSPEQYHIEDDLLVLRNDTEFQPHQYVLRESLGGEMNAQVCLETYVYWPSVWNSEPSVSQATRGAISRWYYVILMACFYYIQIMSIVY